MAAPVKLVSSVDAKNSLDAIETSLSESSQMNRGIGITFLIYVIFCFYMALATNDLMLFLPEVFRFDLAVVQIKLNIEKFYLMAPFFLVFFHYNILNNLVHQIYKVVEWDTVFYESRNGLHLVRHSHNQSSEVREIELGKKQHIKPFLINYCFVKYGEKFANHFARIVFFFFTFLFPLAVLCFMLARFAQYQSIGYTTCHFSLLYVDFGLCIIFMSNIMRIIQNKNSTAFRRITDSTNVSILEDWFDAKIVNIKTIAVRTLSAEQITDLDNLKYFSHFPPAIYPAKINPDKNSEIHLDVLALKAFTDFYHEEKEIAIRQDVHNKHTILLSIFQWIFLLLSLLTLKVLYDAVVIKPREQFWAFFILGVSAFSTVGLFAMVFVPSKKALPLFLEHSLWVKLRRWIALLSLLTCICVGLYYLSAVLDGQCKTPLGINQIINSALIWDKIDYHLDIRNEKFHNQLYPNDPLIGVQWERREVKNRSLRDADFFQTDLSGFIFNNVHFYNNPMTYTSFDNAHFYQTVFKNVNFRYNSFSKTLFDSCQFIDCHFYASELCGTVFNACLIQRTIFDTANIKNCIFDNNSFVDDTMKRCLISASLFGKVRGEAMFLFKNNKFLDSTLFLTSINGLHKDSDAAFDKQCFSCLAFDSDNNQIILPKYFAAIDKKQNKAILPAGRPSLECFAPEAKMPSRYLHPKLYYEVTSQILRKKIKIKPSSQRSTRRSG